MAGGAARRASRVNRRTIVQREAAEIDAVIARQMRRALLLTRDGSGKPQDEKLADALRGLAMKLQEARELVQTCMNPADLEGAQ